MKLLILTTRQPTIERYWGNSKITQEVAEELRSGGLETEIANANSTLELDKLLVQLRPELVFPNGYFLLESPGHPLIAKVLDDLSVPYVGSSASTLEITASKANTKPLLVQNGIPTPNYAIFDSVFDPILADHISYPAITKLDLGAESIGMKKVHDEFELEKAVKSMLQEYGQKVIVEDFVRVKEYTVGVLGNDISRKINPTLVNLQTGYEWRSTESKENQHADVLSYIDNETKRSNVENVAYNTAKTLGLRDWGRMDILEDNKGNLFVVDINAVPGLKTSNPPSSYPMSAQLNLGLSHSQTANAVVYEALKRSGLLVPDQMQEMLANYISEQKTHALNTQVQEQPQRQPF